MDESDVNATGVMLGYFQPEFTTYVWSGIAVLGIIRIVSVEREHAFDTVRVNLM